MIHKFEGRKMNQSMINWKKRPLNTAINKELSDSGVEPFEAYLLASRLDKAMNIGLVKGILDVSYENPLGMHDMPIAAERIQDAIQNQEHVLIACDYDADGLGAAVIVKESLKLMGLAKNKISVMVSNRYKGGYGFNDEIVDRIINLDKTPALIITVDEGSADHERIKRLKDEKPNIDVIVTDHHEVPEQQPEMAFAFVNPNRPEDAYPLKEICGAVVGWLTMQAVLDLRQKKGLNEDINLEQLLDIALISTIGDMMPLNLPINRAIVNRGLQMANSVERKPFWHLLQENKYNSGEAIDETDIGFGIGPRINAMSRIGKDPVTGEDKDPLIVVKLLTEQNYAKASKMFDELTEANEYRKKLNKNIYFNHENLIKEKDESQQSIVVFAEDGLSGITGLVAGEIMQKTGKPAICFCEKKDNPEYVTGSGRSIKDVHIKKAASNACAQLNDEKSACGGHPGACGLTIRKRDIEKFEELFEKEVLSQIDGKKLAPFIYYDGQWKHPVNVELYEKVKSLGPFGRCFEEPVFAFKGIVERIRVSASGTTLILQLNINGSSIACPWFNCKKADEDVFLQQGDHVKILGKVGTNTYKDITSIQIIIEDLKKEL